jgi:peptidyl-prolyl cis-trans isomerase SDCCAG10
MSSTTPITNGKVILYTTMGEIEIDLWSKEAPKTCRNFVQLCLEGYYNGCIFHRIIEDFIVQTGDATGTGSGGTSIYGKPFESEFHSRLRFKQRGLVASAHEDCLNDSQFFITLNKAEELNFKHTIFGRVVGNSIYNVLKMGELEVDEQNRPVYPPKILKTDVVSNPFPDIQIRKNITLKQEEDKPQKKKKKKAVKNINLLSFSDEIDQSISSSSVSGGIESRFDVLANSKQSKKSTINIEDKSRADTSASTSKKSENNMKTVLESAKSDREKADKVIDSSPNEKSVRIFEKEISSAEETSLPDNNAQKNFDFLKSKTIASANTDKKSLVEERRNKYVKRKRSKEEREEEALRKISKFTSSLKASSDNVNESWKSHKLTFDKSNKKEVKKAEDEYVVYDASTYSSEGEK